MIIIVNLLHILYLFYLQLMWVDPVVHKAKCSFLFMLTGPQLVLGSDARNRRYLKMWLFSMNRECECLVLV